MLKLNYSVIVEDKDIAAVKQYLSDYSKNKNRVDEYLRMNGWTQEEKKGGYQRFLDVIKLDIPLATAICAFFILNKDSGKELSQANISEILQYPPYAVSRVVLAHMSKPFIYRHTNETGDIIDTAYLIQEIGWQSGDRDLGQKTRKFYQLVEKSADEKDILAELEEDNLICKGYRCCVDKKMLFLKVMPLCYNDKYTSIKAKIDEIIGRISNDLKKDSILYCDVSTDYRDGSSVIMIVFNQESSGYNDIVSTLFSGKK